MKRKAITRTTSSIIRMNPTIVINDLPKVENLRKQLPGLYKAN
jgi:hypothetical protein